MWGLPIGNHRRYWGARAILARSEIDLLPDRQSVVLDEPLSKADRAFMDWVNKKGLPWLRKHVRSSGLCPDSYARLKFEDGRFVIEATPNGSYGYLYIGAAELNQAEVPCGAQ